MHPIIAVRERLALYLASWVLLGLLIAALIAAAGRAGWSETLLLVPPAALVYAFVCLASWYPCKANPVPGTDATRLLVVHSTAAAFSTALWLLVLRGWAAGLERLFGVVEAPEVARTHGALFLAAGVLLYLLAAAVHYLELAFAASRRAEREALELRMLAQEAELEVFKSQIDPHFLFNSLNSISSLCGSDPAAARRMCIRLGDFLRASLELGPRHLIPLRRELELAQAFIDVERVRFGQRLAFERRAASGLEVLVPPLVLQPLLENALKHGVAHLVEGGRVRLEAEVAAGELRLLVENGCDPERPRGEVEGIGLANVRSRLRLIYGERARMTVREEPDRFSVVLHLPVDAGAEAAA